MRKFIISFILGSLFLIKTSYASTIAYPQRVTEFNQNGIVSINQSLEDIYNWINSTGRNVVVSDTVYGATWDAVTTIAPSKNAVYDKIETLNSSLTSTDTIAKTKYIYLLIPDDTLTTGTDKLGRVYMDFAGTIQEAHASVKTAPTGADLIVDLNLNGSTIWSTQANRVTIAASANTGTQTTFNTTTFASGDYFTIDLDQVGSTVAGAKLVVRLKVLKT